MAAWHQAFLVMVSMAACVAAAAGMAENLKAISIWLAGKKIW